MTAENTAAEHVIIVGGGVIGCSIAHRLAGSFEVTLIEQSQIAAEASGLASGNTTVSKPFPEIPEIVSIVEEFYNELDGTGQFQYNRRPRVGLLVEELVAEKRREVELLNNHGIPADLHSIDAIEEKYPHLDGTGYSAAIEYYLHGWVDPYTLTTTLKESAESAGARLMVGQSATDIAVQNGRVTGVRTDEATISGDHVVSAVGWRTREFLSDYVEIPLKPLKIQALTLEPDWEDGWQYDHPMGHIEDQGIYWRPELNGDLLVGDGHTVPEHPEVVATGTTADQTFIDDITRTVPEVMPDLASARVNNAWAGLDGMTPDIKPIIDAPSEGPEGLYVAQGSHSGFAVAPFASLGIRCLIAGETCPFPLDPFSIDRFGIRSADWDVDRLPPYFRPE